MGYIEPLTGAGERTAKVLTESATWGGAVSYRAQPCLVFYGVPVWIMPNGFCRVGDPDAPMIDVEHAVRTLKSIREEGLSGASDEHWSTSEKVFAEAEAAGLPVRGMIPPDTKWRPGVVVYAACDDPTVVAFAEEHGYTVAPTGGANPRKRYSAIEVAR